MDEVARQGALQIHDIFSGKSAQSLFDPFNFSLGVKDRKHSEKKFFLRSHETQRNKKVYLFRGQAKSGGEAKGKERKNTFHFGRGNQYFHFQNVLCH